jgi:hypothetical protein
MWFIDKRPKIRLSQFIEREAGRIIHSDEDDVLRRTLSTAGTVNVPEVELIALRLWMTLVAMGRAEIADSVQSRLWSRTFEQVEDRYGSSSRELVEGASLEYLRLTFLDMGNERAQHFLPLTMGFMLRRLVGNDDASVVALRTALLAVALSGISAEAAFFRGIKVT